MEAVYSHRGTVAVKRRRPEAYARHFERLYAQYNRPEYIRPDPLQFLHDYPDARDREIVGLIASGLAYGRVAQILRSVETALERMGPSPASFVENASQGKLARTFDGFKHRFSTGDELAALLWAAKQVCAEYGSLGRCLASCIERDNTSILPALTRFTDLLRRQAGHAASSVLSAPEKGSACKRLNLYLRWMVRRDAVDPGGWDQVSPALLIVPLDTHMFRIGLALGLIRRNQPNMAAALELSAAFRRVAPDDPVRYDFALTRLGIREDTDRGAFIRQCVQEN